jgi:hypothetical protein
MLILDLLAPATIEVRSTEHIRTQRVLVTWHFDPGRASRGASS